MTLYTMPYGKSPTKLAQSICFLFFFFLYMSILSLVVCVCGGEKL